MCTVDLDNRIPRTGKGKVESRPVEAVPRPSAQERFLRAITLASAAADYLDRLVDQEIADGFFDKGADFLFSRRGRRL